LISASPISATTGNAHGHEESNPRPRWTPTCLSDYGAGSARTTAIGNKRTLWFLVKGFCVLKFVPQLTITVRQHLPVIWKYNRVISTWTRTAVQTNIILMFIAFRSHSERTNIWWGEPTT